MSTAVHRRRLRTGGISDRRAAHAVIPSARGSLAVGIAQVPVESVRRITVPSYPRDVLHSFTRT